MFTTPFSLGRETMTALRELIVEPITTSSRTTIVSVPSLDRFHRYAWHSQSPSPTTSTSTHRSGTPPIPGNSSARWRSAHPQLAPSVHRLPCTLFDDRRRVNAWVTPHEALLNARTSAVNQNPTPVAYPIDHGPWNLAVDLEIELNGSIISCPPFASTYWTLGQPLARQTINGADVCVGDLFASGTISGTQPDQFGSLIELTSTATRPLVLADGPQCGFLEDGDCVTIRASAPSMNGGQLHLGEVRATITGSN